MPKKPERIVSASEIPSVKTPLSTSLQGTKEEQAKEPKTLFVQFTDLSNMSVTFTGMWSGLLLKGVIRRIEKQYRSFRVEAMRERIRQEQAINKNQEKMEVATNV